VRRKTKKKEKKSYGSHVWRGNRGPPRIEAGSGNLEEYAK
jgi:hypothetical protein